MSRRLEIEVRVQRAASGLVSGSGLGLGSGMVGFGSEVVFGLGSGSPCQGLVELLRFRLQFHRSPGWPSSQRTCSQ